MPKLSKAKPASRPASSTPTKKQRTKPVAVARTPLMGWSSWNAFRVHISEDLIKETTNLMVSKGLKRAGYNYINIDDGWGCGRDEKGIVTAREDRFPSGMKSLAAYIHKKGFKAGIYTDGGTQTCGIFWDNEQIPGYGAYQHELQDMFTYFLDWGYDFLKVDWCGGDKLGLNPRKQYTRIRKAIDAVKKPVVYNVCSWGFPGAWITRVAHSWRIGVDIRVDYKQWCDLAETAESLSDHHGPGHFNDLDMLQVGRGATPDEDRTHFSLWCMVASPLLLGNDVRTMSAETLELISNREVIAIDQDPLCKCAHRLQHGIHQIWVKPLADKTMAILLQNKDDKVATITLRADLLSLSEAVAATTKIRDLWKHENCGKLGRSRKFEVAPHGVVMLRLTH